MKTFNISLFKSKIISMNLLTFTRGLLIFMLQIYRYILLYYV